MTRVKIIVDCDESAAEIVESNIRAIGYWPTLSSADKSPDSNVEKNRELLLQRSVVGLQKYGVTTDKANLTQREWLQHALEEALDLANYLQAAISQIEAEENLLLKLKEQVIEVFDGEESARQSAEYFYALLEAAKRDR